MHDEKRLKRRRLKRLTSVMLWSSLGKLFHDRGARLTQASHNWTYIWGHYGERCSKSLYRVSGGRDPAVPHWGGTMGAAAPGPAVFWGAAVGGSGKNL